MSGAKAKKLWAKREEKCLRIICCALQLLRNDNDLPEQEDDLNRKLDSALLEAQGKLFPEDQVPHVYESRNQPDADDQQRAKREGKRPDFQWIVYDRYTGSRKAFVLECKRLGQKTGSGWDFNKNYSHKGIARFRDPECGYAKSMPSGAMVGYWQNMGGVAVLKAVNKGCKEISLPKLAHVGKWKLKDVTCFEQTLKRDFKISPFTLHHFWVDIRVKPV